MRLTRVYVETPLSAGRQLLLEGSAANHIARVLRLRVGDALTLFDGSGGEFGARVEALRKESVVVGVEEHRAIERESPLSLTLALFSLGGMFNDFGRPGHVLFGHVAGLSERFLY